MRIIFKEKHIYPRDKKFSYKKLLLFLISKALLVINDDFFGCFNTLVFTKFEF